MEPQRWALSGIFSWPAWEYKNIDLCVFRAPAAIKLTTAALQRAAASTGTGSVALQLINRRGGQLKIISLANSGVSPAAHIKNAKKAGQGVKECNLEGEESVQVLLLRRASARCRRLGPGASCAPRAFSDWVRLWSICCEEHFHGSLAFGFKVKGCHFSLAQQTNNF